MIVSKPRRAVKGRVPFDDRRVGLLPPDTDRSKSMSRLPIPRLLKTPLVLLWNQIYWRGLRALAGAGAVVRGRVERCSACGQIRPMLYYRRIIPNRLVELWGLTPRQAAALAHKESDFCSACGAKQRARRIASVLLELYPVGAPQSPTRAASLREWTRDPAIRRLRVAEINRVDGLHEALRELPNFEASDYVPGAAPGASADGVRNEDLCRLTYPDASFELIVTSETLEHVPDLRKALAQIHRALAPGGRHVFTAPVAPWEPKTFPRARSREDGEVEHLTAPIHHPAGDTGYLVFTELGTDFPEILRDAGFETSVYFGPVRDDDLAQVYVCRKPLP